MEGCSAGQNILFPLLGHHFFFFFKVSQIISQQCQWHGKHSWLAGERGGKSMRNYAGRGNHPRVRNKVQYSMYKYKWHDEGTRAARGGTAFIRTRIFLFFSFFPLVYKRLLRHLLFRLNGNHSSARNPAALSRASTPQSVFLLRKVRASSAQEEEDVVGRRAASREPILSISFVRKVNNSSPDNE